jgi:hypothetical protein
MTIPEFNAEKSLYTSTTVYRGHYFYEHFNLHIHPLGEIIMDNDVEEVSGVGEIIMDNDVEEVSGVGEIIQ